MPRRRQPSGAGSVWQRPDGRWSGALWIRQHDPTTGRTIRRRLTTTRRSWEEAHAWLVERQGDAKRNLLRPSEDPRLSEFLTGWLRDVVAPGVAPKTLEKRRYHVAKIDRALGHMRLAKLQPRQIHLFYLDLARSGTLGLSTRRAIHTTLKMALNQAVRWSLLTQNPLDLVDPPRENSVQDSVQDRVRALTDEQARALFAAMSGPWREWAIVAVRTGLRPGESLALRWGDVELDSDPASVTVRRTLGLRSGELRPEGEGQFYFKAPKSKASRRTVVLHHEAVDALHRQRETLAERGHPTGPESLVFPSKRGTPMDRGNLSRRFVAPALERAGLPSLTLHEMRHTYASIALHEWGLPPAVVQEILGHASLSMTVDLYGHLMPNAQADAMRAVRRLSGEQREGLAR
jgi:integrase